MATLKFTDSHNMVAFLSKPVECEGFEQIVDFLNAHTIKYALTINPTIYTSCIEQFWATIKAKTVNGEVQLQALLNGKKVIITESTIRRYLQLEDAEGVDCLPNATIFEQLTLMSTMASAIISLATNQKFNFSKYKFESMVKNLENVFGKFLMYLRFIQVFLDNQLKGMPTHTKTYISPCHSKKIFGNMRRTGKGFSGRETPLFQTIVKQRPRKPLRKNTKVPQPSGSPDIVADEAVNEEMDDSLMRATITASSLEAEQDSGNINKTQSKATPNEPSSLGTSSGNTLRSGEDSLKLQELMELCTNLQQRVLDLEHTKTTQAQKIDSLKRRVKKLEKKQRSRAQVRGVDEDGGDGGVGGGCYDDGLGGSVGEVVYTTLLSMVYEVFCIREKNCISLVSTHFDTDTNMFGVHDLVGDEVVVETEVASKDMNLSVDEVTLAQALAALKSAKPKADKVVIQQPKIKTTTAATTVIAASTRPKAKGLVIHEEEQATTPIVYSQQPSQVKVQDKGKGIMVEEPLKMKKKYQAEIDADYQLAQRLQAEETELVEESSKKAEVMEESSKRAEIAQESRSKRAGDELEQEVVKKQKVDVEKETEQEKVELQSLMKIVPDEEEVSIDSIPLATKPPSIVDWKILKEGKIS
ncbi:hypothetical protein Tco_0598367 [Tanacetum coccineum]